MLASFDERKQDYVKRSGADEWSLARLHTQILAQNIEMQGGGSATEWRTYEVVADVPRDADLISYGLYLVGDGKAWLDSVSVEVVE